MPNKLCMVVLQAVICVFLVNSYDNCPRVKVNQGILKGKYLRSSNGKLFSAFLSVPYAEPPVGAIRFKEPFPARSWNGIRDSTIPHQKCLQIDAFSLNPTWDGIEDCLYLNVFTPQLNPTEKSIYNVMIFIHGGGYSFGSALMYEADYIINYNIILVTLNYRLGPLGFFSTGDTVVPGNNGLKDQVLAIKWVYDNIRSFGGDPEQITLFGESAGGASVHLHYFSPLSKGLFKRGISQSGSSFCSWAIGEKDIIVSRSKKLANALGCSKKSHYDLVKCLQKIEAKKIVQQAFMFMEWNVEPIVPFKPIILSEQLIDIMKSGKYASLPWITGINSEEGALRASAFYKQSQLIQDIDINFSYVMSVIFESKHINFSKIRRFYFGDRKIDNSTRFELVDLFTDFMFTFCGNIAVNLHLKYSNQPVYYYLFGHKYSYSFSQIFGEHHPLYGTCHCDELLALFPINTLFYNTEKTILDKRVSHLLSTMWTNFAKTGNPTPIIDTLIQTKWEPVTTSELEYSFIGNNMYSAKGMYSNRMKFWRNFSIFENYTKIINEF